MNDKLSYEEKWERILLTGTLSHFQREELIKDFATLEQRVDDLDGELHACRAAFQLMQELDTTNAALEAKLSKMEEALKRIVNDANDGRAFTGITAERYRGWCDEALAGSEEA